jgi:signal transduction histidine kinase
LEIVLRNLLSNAIKFSRQGDRITIFATEQGAQMQIGIRDEGIGMTAAELEKISCVSTRFSKQGTAQEKGMGLGLLLCQSYLHHMNSQLSIVSEFQKGSEFSFTLDCIQGHADDQDTPRQDWSDCHCSAIFHTDPSRF